MDEVVGLLAEQISKRIRSAQQSARSAQQGARPAPVPPAIGAAQPADPLSTRRLRRDMPAEAAATLPAPGAAPAAPSAPAVSSAPVLPSELLAAFHGGPPLLASLVLAEALGPPLALQPFEARRR